MTFTIWSLILGQISMILEWALKREVTKASKDVYEATVASRGKSADFWKPYFEEWELPPVERAQRSLLRQSWYAKLSGPLVRMLVLKGASRFHFRQTAALTRQISQVSSSRSASYPSSASLSPLRCKACSWLVYCINPSVSSFVRSNRDSFCFHSTFSPRR